MGKRAWLWWGLAQGLVLAAACSLPRSGEAPDAQPAGGGGADPTTTSTATTATQGGGGAVVTSTTTSTITEDCLNGRDDDNNGLVDCGDPACQPDHVCVPAAPSGWDGFVAVDVYDYDSAPAPGTCPDGSTAETRFADPGGPAECADCGCDLNGVSCTLPALEYYDQNNCGGAPDTLYTASVQCNFLSICDNCSSPRRMRRRDSALTGSCAPPAGEVLTLPSPWQLEHHVCPIGASLGGCGANEVCVALPPEPTKSQVCVAQPGTHACEGAYAEERHVAFSGVADDTRACECTGCDDSGLDCTGGVITLFDDGGCLGNTGSGSVTVGSSCMDPSSYLDNNSASFEAEAGTITGNCVGDPPNAVGEVVGEEPVTICCREVTTI